MRQLLAFLLVVTTAEVIGQETIRYRVYKELRKPYEACVVRLEQERYDAELDRCQSNRKHHKDRCFHDAELAATTKRTDELDPNAECDYLKPTKEDFLKRLQEIRNDTNVAKPSP